MDFRWKDWVLLTPWVNEECLYRGLWHCMSTTWWKGGSSLKKPCRVRSLGFLFLVALAEHVILAGNYASFLPHFPGLDFSSSCLIPHSTDQVILQYQVGASPNNLTNDYHIIPCKRDKYYPYFKGAKIKAIWSWCWKEIMLNWQHWIHVTYPTSWL